MLLPPGLVLLEYGSDLILMLLPPGLVLLEYGSDLILMLLPPGLVLLDDGSVLISMLLPPGLVLLDNGSVLTSDESTSLLDSSLGQILTVTVRTQCILNHLDRMSTSLQC